MLSLSRAALFLSLASLAVASAPSPSVDDAAPILDDYQANLANLLTNAAVELTPDSNLDDKDDGADLYIMLKRAQADVDAAGPSSASPSAHWEPAATAMAASPTSHGGPSPSASHDPSARARRQEAKRNLEKVERMIHEAPWQDLDSRLLCPTGMSACPIFPRMGSWECVDTRVELENCGGCASKGQGEDCTAIKGALGVTCEMAQCTVYSCQDGYELRRDSKGRERCRRSVGFGLLDILSEHRPFARQD